MIPANLSLVPFSPERRAAMEAIAEVERRRSRGAVSAAYPYGDTHRDVYGDGHFLHVQSAYSCL